MALEPAEDDDVLRAYGGALVRTGVQFVRYIPVQRFRQELPELLMTGAFVGLALIVGTVVYGIYKILQETRSY